MHRLTARFLAVFLALATVSASAGCGTDDTDDKPSNEADGAAGADASGSSDTAAANDTAASSANPWLPDGDYFIGVSLTEFQGLKLKMKAKIKGAGEKGKASKIAHVELRAMSFLDGDSWTQDKPLGTLNDVAIDEKGAFIADFGKVVVPGKGLPTGSPTDVVIVIHGTFKDDDTFCGLLKGEVPVFKAKLEKSTFKALPFGKQKDPGFDVSCEGAAQTKKYKHIDKCPTFVAGPNKITSAEVERTFIVDLPASATGTKPLPIVFNFHGVGGSAAKFRQETKFADLLGPKTAGGSNDFILITPDSATIDGKKDTLDWFFQGELFDLDNRDLVFFDDLVKCAGKAWPIDSKRVYVTGMSGGGLISTFIAMHRGKVVAAAAPFSGGYNHTWPEKTEKTPFFVIWGGEKDFAFKQNFHNLANTLIANLKKTGNPHLSCNHGLQHKYPATGAQDAWEFLKQFTLGGGEKPDASKLPAYCK